MQTGGYGLEDARKDLAATGLGVLTPRELELNDVSGFVLAIPNEHPLVGKLFMGKPWQNGGWKDALRQCPIDGVMISSKEKNRVAIGGVQKRCTLVVMSKYHGAPER